ncbi:thermonuclease family protein [Conexibacter sp. JD483]|uniref:thermonuclease family protein n=1 Tax=unclassified Conexibacter TaxID=2627773 RepID=UPI00272513CA|nr:MULTISPECIES: thermonuclease family protein [unclassified Conexibacter]MDO8185943.1 thermonuclease family protein [Conexibacter sp. CPCC 205706]MDO8199434.1 thermonuclease family protein [Conexibacter sp. CPCC 205762]MDR9368552.1 thermonuclease family protein [Conexibacter sp. JD483]
MSWSRALPWIVLLLAAGLLLGDVRPPGGWPSWLGGGDSALRAGGRAQAQVERVVDGDTIAVTVAGAAERVRYIGVDTPETVKPNAPVECFGPAASAFNRELVRAGERVTLRFDRELRDRYGRLLAYVYRDRDALFVNARLVGAGAARTLEISPNTAHAAELARLQAQARAAGRGLWSACL